MNKNIRIDKCHHFQYEIAKAKILQLHDKDMTHIKKVYKFLEGFISKIYARQKKISRRKSNYLIDRVSVNLT